MELVLKIISYVAGKFLDLFLQQEGYGRLKKEVFPKENYNDRLNEIIDETINEHKKLYHYKYMGNKYPFYESQILFEELNKHDLFETQYSADKLRIKLQENPNIIVPSKEELKSFYDRLVTKIKKDVNIKELFIKENYQSKIFEIYELNKNPEIKTGAPRLPKELTAKIPRTPQEKIVGREAELEDLHQRLFDNKQVVLVNGLGGIGKTTLAQVYTDTFWEKYHHIAWISQVNQDFVRDFITTEGLLHNLNIQSEGKEPKEVFIHLISEFKKITDSPNLLIIDNADSTLTELKDYLPSQPLWHILVTSREKIDKFDLKELDFLSEDKAVSLFLFHYRRGKISMADIKELVKMVDLHTLTVEILAKTANLHRIDMRLLKNAIENDLRANVCINHAGDNKIEKVTSYLCSIFNFSQIIEYQFYLLQQFVCLPFEFHEYDLLKDLIFFTATAKEINFSENLGLLSDKGWLLRNRKTDSYKMHRIIADVIKKRHPIELSDVEPLIKNITEKLSVDQTKDNPVDKFVWIPFGKSVLSVFPDSSESVISALQNNLSLRLQDRGEFEKTIELLEKMEASDEQKYGPNHQSTALCSSILVEMLKANHDYPGAKARLEKATASAEKNFGPDHPNTALSYLDLAKLLIELGDYKGALELYGKALRIFQKVLPAGHPTIKIASNNHQYIKDLMK